MSKQSMTPTVPMPKSVGDVENPGGLHHIPALDGVRGLAILLVLADHLFWSNNHFNSRLMNLLSGIRSSSWTGVNLFFVLSGFLITGILWETLHKPHFFRNFYARRSLRIFPLYYTFLLLLLTLTPFLHMQWNGGQYLLLTYSTNLAFWHTAPMNLSRFNVNHFWTLQIEEQFYLVWPLIVYRVRKIRALLMVGLSLSVMALFFRITSHVPAMHLPRVFYVVTLDRADDLLYGCMLALLIRTPARKWILAHAPIIFWSCCALCVAMGIRYGTFMTADPLIDTFGLVAVDFAACALIAMSMRPGSRTAGFLGNSTLRWFGRYSYGLYVYHYSIYGFITPWVRPYVKVHTSSNLLGVLLNAAVVGGVSCLVAFASYHLYEVHFLKLKRFFGYTKVRGASVEA